MIWSGKECKPLQNIGLCSFLFFCKGEDIMSYQLINLEEHATFETIQAMDNTVRQYNAQINKAHYETLNLLKQYSCKVIGVSHIKIKTIADRLGKSVRTIKRHLKHLKEQGFISVINTMRSKIGGKGANAYVINPVEVQQKIINVTSQMSRRKADKKRSQHQSQQAMAFVRTKKETISFLKLLTSFVSNKRRHKQIKLKRIENIKYFRTCPQGVPVELYQRYQPFFSDAQIKCLFNKISDQINQYPNINDEEYTDIINNTLDSLVKALRNYHRGQGDKIYNIFAYATAAAKYQTLRQYSMKLWENPPAFTQDDDDTTFEAGTTFKQASMAMWEKAGLFDDEGMPY
uniref:Putative orfP2 protein n=1 Tax=Staphylococcus staphylolyticus TaxID=1287 RepID=D3X7J9_STAST|nr:replication/maintenance protein RepL [Staphylococcus simulans]ADD24871.1 putative orfP2 protein [Staphylococcus simulans bv. staphylolyticus]ADD24920.1 putative orfP2 protein [Staphylococcus simulans bv. staphylolyticus]